MVTEPVLVHKPRQQGIALIYVLLIFLLITTVASEIVTNLWLHTEKNARYLARTQAKQYALGAEQYVAGLLEQDFLQDQKTQRMVDHNLESWRVATTSYEVEQGSVELHVEDEQGRFNINWLQARRSGADTAGDSPYLPMLENLLIGLSINPQLADNIQQWLNKDQNQPSTKRGMVSVSELMLVDGVGREDVARLLPYIAVIPARTKMNINTAPAEVIRLLHQNLTDTDAQRIKNGLGKNGLASAEELRRLAALSGKDALFNEGLRQGGLLAFNSHYFSARIKATYRDTTFCLTTLFHRNHEGRVEVVSREIGPAPVYHSPEV